MKKDDHLGNRFFQYPLALISALTLVAVVIMVGASSPTLAHEDRFGDRGDYSNEYDDDDNHGDHGTCLLILGTDAKTLDIEGSSKLSADDCTVTLLSNSTPALSVVGSSKLEAEKVCAKSSSITGSSRVTPNPDPSCAVGSDPFVQEPTPTVGDCDHTNLSFINSSKNTLEPGVYCGNTSFGGSTKNTLSPGVYIIKDGVLKVDGSAQVSGNGVVLFFTGSNTGFRIDGSAKVSLSAPKSGTLKGFAIYLDPAASANSASFVSGSSQLTLKGITYLPTQELIVSGSSKVIVSRVATYVLKALKLSGHTNFKAEGSLPQGPSPDTTAPVIAPHNDVAAVGTIAGATVLYDIPTSTDDIDGDVPVSCSPPPGSVFPLGTTLVTCTSQDAVGNQATPTTFNVIVTLPPDTTAPVIAPHDDITVGGTLSGVVVTYTNPAASDDIDSSVLVSCAPASGSLFAFGTTTVTCTAQDSTGNNALPTSFNVFVVDQVAPIIAPHENILATGTSLGAIITYANPTASDNVDTTVEVACSPASGSLFDAGTTTVFCNAQDSAGNVATAVSFDVVVVVIPPTPFTMATQGDESFLCAPDWENCFTGNTARAVIPLGLGSTLGQGSLLSVTIAKDESSPFVSQPWIIQLQCFTNNTYATTCSDWVQPNAWNGFRTYLVSESATTTTNNKHWTAYFTNPAHSTNNNGTSPVMFNPNYYYQLIINDNGWNIGAYGSSTLSLPYYIITGMTL